MMNIRIQPRKQNSVVVKPRRPRGLPAEQILREIEASRLSKREITRRAKSSMSTLHRWSHGIQVPSPETIAKYRAVLR